MHMEPEIVTGAKALLGYATGTGMVGFAALRAGQAMRAEGIAPVALRSAIATGLVFCFFEVFPHHPVGVSEVHFILGSTLFLLFGAAPAAIGLTLGLLVQGLFFAPFDLPQFGMNVTTLLVPLFAMAALAERIIPAGTAYVDVGYKQAFQLSATFQGGIAAWVAFWAVYGGGLGAQNLVAVGTFFLAYMTVVLFEPLIDLGILAIAKTARGVRDSGLFATRLHRAAS